MERSEDEQLKDGAARGGTVGEGAFQALQALMMLAEPDRAAQLYEELGSAQRERLQKEAAQAAVEERQRLSEVMRRARDFAGARGCWTAAGRMPRWRSCTSRGGQYVAAAEAYLRDG
ncbi:cyclic nucleotide-binding domain-containing protein, partial [Pyxidicoccus sp. 3LFB2]